jgi:hypothetical protein
MPTSEQGRTYLESLIREDFERCHPGETLEDLKRRASFSKEDRGLLRDWMAIAARRAAADQAKRLTSTAYGAAAWSFNLGGRECGDLLISRDVSKLCGEFVPAYATFGVGTKRAVPSALLLQSAGSETKSEPFRRSARPSVAARPTACGEDRASDFESTGFNSNWTGRIRSRGQWQTAGDQITSQRPRDFRGTDGGEDSQVSC